MDETQKTDNAEAVATAHEALHTLLTTQQSAVLATVNADGLPLASYAPFVADPAKNFYVFASTLSQHTGNLLRTGQASVMLIADEAETTQIFARARLTFACTAAELPRDGETWQVAAAHYEERFASMFSLLRGLGDFKMFKLKPYSGALVVGFGAAYTVGGDEMDHLTPRGPGNG